MSAHKGMRGQAMLEYTWLTAVLALTALIGFVYSGFGPTLIEALQLYVDLFIYALDVAVG